MFIIMQQKYNDLRMIFILVIKKPSTLYFYHVRFIDCRTQYRAIQDMYIIGTKSSKVRQVILEEQESNLETTKKESN